MNLKIFSSFLFVLVSQASANNSLATVDRENSYLSFDRKDPFCKTTIRQLPPVYCDRGYNRKMIFKKDLSLLQYNALRAPASVASSDMHTKDQECVSPQIRSFTPSCSVDEVAVQNSGLKKTTNLCEIGEPLGRTTIIHPGICQRIMKICSPDASQGCKVPNGEGTQICSKDGTRWGICLATSCTPEFTPIWDSCISNIELVKTAGNYLSSCWKDGKIFCGGNSGPSVYIGLPHRSVGDVSSHFNFSITFEKAVQISLSETDVMLSGSGSPGCLVSVTGSGIKTRTVAISNCSGNGEIMISIASGTAEDSNGRKAPSVGPSTAAIVSNITATSTKSPLTGEYQGKTSNQKFDVYLPQDWESRQNWPALIWVHGGGWTGGTRGDDANMLSTVASLGVVVVSIDYTRAPGYDYRDDYYGKHRYATSPYTAGIEDIQIAMNSFFNSTSNFRVDPSKVSLGGISAGGHLALYQSTSPQNIYKYNCVVSIAALTNLTRKWTFYPVTNYVIGKVMGTNTADLHALSPALHAYDLKALRTLIVHGVEDNLVPIDQAMDFVSWLKIYQPTHDLTVNYQSESNPYPIVNPKPEEIDHAAGDYLSSLVGYFQAHCL